MVNLTGRYFALRIKLPKVQRQKGLKYIKLHNPLFTRWNGFS